MARSILRFFSLLAFIAVGSATIWFYGDHFSAQHQIQQLEEKNRVLHAVVQRLSDEKRVAELLVTDQSTVNGKLKTTLLFVEYDPQGNSLPPRSFTIDGNEAHVDALVIRFNQNFVETADPLRGHSIALFHRIYGSEQAPSSGQPIDTPGVAPAVYADPKDQPLSKFETELWQNFWKLADDASYRAQFGVELANGQGVWGPFQPDRLYTLTLQAHGGLSMTSEPLKGIYREALKQKMAPAL